MDGETEAVEEEQVFPPVIKYSENKVSVHETA